MRRGLVLLAVGVMSLSLDAPVAADGTVTVVGVVQVQPLEVTFELQRSEADTGERVHAIATVRNHGPASLRDPAVTLRTPDAVSVGPHWSRRIVNLGSGGARSVRWQVCGDEPGTYGLLAQVEAVLPGRQEVTVESRVQMLAVVGEGRHPCS